ncbi:MAG: Fic family protein [Halieaceae bacterium]
MDVFPVPHLYCLYFNRLQKLVYRSDTLKPEAFFLLDEAFRRGKFERREIERITGIAQRSAQRVLKQLIENEKLLASSTPKGPVSLRFPAKHLPVLLPNLFAGA